MKVTHTTARDIKKPSGEVLPAGTSVELRGSRSDGKGGWVCLLRVSDRWAEGGEFACPYDSKMLIKL